MKLIVLATCFNASRFIKKAIFSLKEQKVTIWHCYIIDDLSTDKTVDLVRHLISGDDRFTLIVNKEKRYQVGNYWNVLQRSEIEDEDLCVILDGDDWLSCPEVFDNVLGYYRDPKTWITCGKFIPWYGKNKPLLEAHAVGAKPSPFKQLRKLPWASSHLITFKAWLFRKIKQRDLKAPHGSFWEVTGDLAYMFPMLEMSGEEHSFYANEINYIYNSENELNDHKVNYELQQLYAELIRTKMPYAQL